MPPERARYDGPVIDMHVHLQSGDAPELGTWSHRPNDYLRATRNIHLRAACALAMAPRANREETGRRNDWVLSLSRRPKSPFLPFCSVHPLDGAFALREIDRVARLGARGVKLHPNTQQFDVADPRVRSIVERATENGLPVLFDAYSPFDPAQPGKFVQLALSVPTARLILAHAHGPNFPQLLVYPILSLYPWWPRQVWIDVSMIGELLAPSPFAKQLAWVLRKVGTDRLLFGSDYPLAPDPQKSLLSLRRLGFKYKEIRAIAHDNAVALLGLPRVGERQG